MKYNSHLIGATITAVTVPVAAKYSGINIPLKELLFIIPAIILGGIISCDIDTNSKASKYYARIGLVLTAYLVYTGYYLNTLIIWIPFGLAKSGKHRGFTHSWLLPIVVIFLPVITDLIIRYFNINIVWLHNTIVKYHLAIISYAIGMYSHLILDIKIIKKIARFIGGEKLVKTLYG